MSCNGIVACSMTGQSLSLPITTPTAGVLPIDDAPEEVGGVQGPVAGVGE